jgi:hypothetical protein
VSLGVSGLSADAEVPVTSWLSIDNAVSATCDEGRLGSRSGEALACIVDARESTRIPMISSSVPLISNGGTTLVAADHLCLGHDLSGNGLGVLAIWQRCL